MTNSWKSAHTPFRCMNGLDRPVRRAGDDQLALRVALPYQALEPGEHRPALVSLGAEGQPVARCCIRSQRHELAIGVDEDGAATAGSGVGGIEEDVPGIGPKAVPGDADRGGVKSGRDLKGGP